MEINTTLLREKFILTGDGENKIEPIIASSNRIPIILKNSNNSVSETYVIRAQNMHLAVRTVEFITDNFIRLGPLMTRQAKFNFETEFNKILSSHEVNFNPNKWITIYSKGKIIFSVGDHHQFLDIIEKCDAINPGNYDHAITIAEEMFLKMGKKLSIKYQSNIGMVIHAGKDNARCGLVLRNPHKNTTFNFNIDKKQDNSNKISPVIALNICAAFLEGIQLAVVIGMINEEIKYKKNENAFINKEKERDSALKRMAQMNKAIAVIENQFHISYRPEKPNFSDIVRETEIFQGKKI